MRKKLVVAAAVAALAGQGCTVAGMTFGVISANSTNAAREQRLAAGADEPDEAEASVGKRLAIGGTIGLVVDAVVVAAIMLGVPVERAGLMSAMTRSIAIAVALSTAPAGCTAVGVTFGALSAKNTNEYREQQLAAGMEPDDDEASAGLRMLAGGGLGFAVDALLVGALEGLLPYN